MTEIPAVRIAQTQPTTKTGNVNTNLHAAKRAKNDEFYTRLTDIEAEIRNYFDPIMPGSRGSNNRRNPFRGKTVFLNCDNPHWSNLWVYFARKFDELEIDTLISTHYQHDGSPSYAMFLERDSSGVMIDNGVDERGVPRGRRQELDGDGDFRSAECVELLERSDVVVTNPPFSLFREYVAQLVEHGKKFLIVGNQNAITYKEIFPLLRDVILWLGVRNGEMAFKVPDDSEPRETRFWIDEGGQKWRSLGNACWFTNLDHKKRHEMLDLYRYYKGNEDAYPRYDNYDAIEVSRVKDIPVDYVGVMGVPITFLDKHNPDQFEIVKFRHGDDGVDVHYGGKTPYFRILIRAVQRTASQVAPDDSAQPAHHHHRPDHQW